MPDVLFVDDQPERMDIAVPYFKSVLGPNTVVVHTDRVPRPDEVCDILSRRWGVISLDNDLGPGLEVINLLKDQQAKDPEAFKLAWREQFVVIHSMNPVAAERIGALLGDQGATVLLKPFRLMKG